MTNKAPEFVFKPAVRESIRLLIALSGGTGSGKSYSGLRLAKGLANGKRFAAIDTENGRLSMYADAFQFDVINLYAPFSPDRYMGAILAAEKAGYEVILIDSGSHEWDGDGGVLDMQQEELDMMVERSKKGGDTRSDWQIEEGHRMRSWIHPKLAHKVMMTRLLQIRSHVIMCLRAAEKIEMVRKDGKTVVQPKVTLTGKDGWVPICEAKLPFEFTASFLLTADKPGVPRPIKLQEQHKAFFPLDKPITEDAGRLIGEWARGGSGNVRTERVIQGAQSLKEAEIGSVSTAIQVSTEPSSGEDGSATAKDTLKVDPQGSVEYLKQIEQASTLSELHKIGQAFADQGFPEEERDLMRDIYKIRLKQLREEIPI